MLYKDLVSVYEKIDCTTKRLEKTYFISELIKETSIEDLEMNLLLLKGELYPSWDNQEIGVASRLILKAISLATGVSIKKVEEGWKNTGDLGKAASKFVSTKKQVTLFSKSLTVEKVFHDLRKLVEITGNGAVDQKVKIIAGLLSSAGSDEAVYIVRAVLEQLRVGVGEGSIRDAIVWSSFPLVVGLFFKCQKCCRFMPNTSVCLECGNAIDNKFSKEIERLDVKLKILHVKKVDDLKKIKDQELIVADKKSLARECYNYLVDAVQSAYDMSNDFGVVAMTARKKGIKGLMNVKMGINKPIKLMLYQKAKDIEDAFDIVGKPAALEYKYDGFRLQVHKYEGGISLFTRRLENVTHRFPDVVRAVKKGVKVKDCILDAEAVGYNPDTKKYLPFQSISQRIKRKYDIEKMAKDFPVELNIFDIIFCDGKSLLDVSFKERRKVLEKAVNVEKLNIVLANQIITSDVKVAKKFYQASLDAGEEGMMAKNLDAPYKPGSRVGYGVKVKPVMETLDLVITGAEWGKGKRKGWLSSFNIACVDEGGNILEIGKVGTGIKELETEEGVTFAQLTELLKPLILSEKGVKVIVKPKIVVEINYEEIQKSPTYNSGYALRFPRMIQIREDKPVNESSGLNLVEQLYAGQR